jgi:antitoxin PrlF
MAVATMTSKGQITIPLAVRTALGLRPGAKVDFVS